tara:strand:+ start:2366 stop:2608 length:243 start_codon:yes stop_codon:yes gene_type:complete
LDIQPSQSALLFATAYHTQSAITKRKMGEIRNMEIASIAVSRIERMGHYGRVVIARGHLTYFTLADGADIILLPVGEKQG